MIGAIDYNQTILRQFCPRTLGQKLLRIVIISLMWLSATSLHSCSSGDSPIEPDVPVIPPTPTEKDQPMLFSPSSESTYSRSTEYITDPFVVYAYKTLATETQTVMPGYTVTHDVDNSSQHFWTYESSFQPLKYWDLSAQAYNFYAYTSKTSLPDGVTISNNDDYTGFTIGGVKANTKSDPVSGILVAHMRRDISESTDIDCYNNETLPIASNFLMPLRFHPITSSVDFWVFNSGVEDGYMSSATVNIAAGKKYYISGDFKGDTWTFSEGGGSKSNIFSIAYSTDVKIEKEKTRADAIQLSSTYEIPQDFGKKITVSFVINNHPLVATFELPENWAIGKNYIYYINVNIDKGEPIIIGLSAVDFVQGFKIDDEEVTDW